MKSKRQFARNRIFNTLVIMGALLVWAASEVFFDDEDTYLALVLGIFGLLFIIVPVVLMPICYAFDKDGVSLIYIFLPTERYLWKSVYAIEVEYGTSGDSSWVALFFGGFAIKGATDGKHRFYMEGTITKSFRTKYLLLKYWDGTITGFLFEDAKKWLKKRKRKKQKKIEQHLTDEIVTLERQVRAEAREYIATFVKQAKEQNLDFRTEYLYITKDMEEHKSRPDEGYTYTLMAEISRFGETDEDRIVVFSVDLIRVRLGKSSYRGVKVESAKEDFEFTAADVWQEIRKNGIEAYCGVE